MALDPLATPEDLSHRLGRDLTPSEEVRAPYLLADASAAVRARARQDISLATSTVPLRFQGRFVRLPQRPVIDVASVTLLWDGSDAEFRWYTGDQVEIWARGIIDSSFQGYSGPNRLEWVEVTYTHGYDVIPGELVGIVCQMAGRALGVPIDQAGLTSETVAGYSYKVGAAAAAGAVGMLLSEQTIVDRYRRRAGTVRLG